MKNCSNLVYLSAIACQIAECLSEAELAKLAADLTVLGDMLTNIIAYRVADDEEQKLKVK